jgi:hypothetical protein
MDVGLGIASTVGQKRGMPTSVSCTARVRHLPIRPQAVLEALARVN